MSVTNSLDALARGAERPRQETLAFNQLDTTRASAVHRFAALVQEFWPAGKLLLLKWYLVSILIAFLPFAMTLRVSSVPIFTRSAHHTLPFFWDANILFMIFISFPCICILTATDQPVLINSLRMVQADGTLVISEIDQRDISERWNRIFRLTNVVGQLFGLFLGALIARINIIAYTQPHVGYWITDAAGKMQPIGFAFAFFIFIVYALATVYVSRNVTIAFLLNDIVARSTLNILPFHPDQSGGLRAVGELGLRNQYTLTLVGLNLVLLVAWSYMFLTIPKQLDGLIVAACVAYLLLGPVVFAGPLLPFRAAMRENKDKVMGEVAQRMKRELDHLREQIPSGPISEQDLLLIDRLRKISDFADELPVWPFNAFTLKKFMSAYIIPIVSSASYPVVRFLLQHLR